MLATLTHAAPLLPDDPYYPSWHVTTLGLPQAWGYSTGSPQVTIAVLDTGVMTTVPDLAGRVLPGKTTTGVSPLNARSYHHGTWVASTAAMGVNNALGGTGVGNFSILPIITTHGQLTTAQAIADGIRLAADDGVRVINISLRPPDLDYGPLNDAAAYARGRGALTFVSAGNSNQREPLTGYEHLIFVAGTGRDDRRWDDGGYGSSWGSYVDLAAPAQDILVAEPGNPAYPTGYAYASGTSFASPLAAGAAALVWSINPALTADAVQSLLYETAVDLGPAGWDEFYGWGRLDIAAAASAAAATLPEPGLLGLVMIPTMVLLGRRRG